MLLFINNSVSSVMSSKELQAEDEVPEPQGMRFLFSGIGISNRHDDVSGLLIPNPFIAFARDLEQVIWNGGEGISFASVPDNVSRESDRELVSKGTKSPERPRRSPETSLVSKSVRKVTPRQTVNTSIVPSNRGPSAFPRRRCRRTSSPAVRRTRMVRARHWRSESRLGGGGREGGVSTRLVSRSGTAPSRAQRMAHARRVKHRRGCG